MRLNAEIGTAKQANVKGYYIGGKTGTAEKVINGRYSKKQVLNSFTAIMPADNPQYQVLVMLDEPKALPETHGFITSGWNAVPTGGKVIARIAPLLGSSRVSTCRPRIALFLRQQDRQLRRIDRFVSVRRMRIPGIRATPAAAAGVMERHETSRPLRRRCCDRCDGGRDRGRWPCRRQPRRAAGRCVLCARRQPRPTARDLSRRRIASGAVAVVGEQRRSTVARRAVRRCCAIRGRRLARAAARFYPRQPPTIAAVTGTSGKTSVAAFTRQIWEQLGYAAAEHRHHRRRGATPQRLWLADDARSGRAASDARGIAGAGVTHLALEASSHGLDQRRLDGVRSPPAASPICPRPHGLSSRRSSIISRAKLRLFDDLLPMAARP